MRYLPIAFLLCLFFLSCKKSGSNNPTKTELITSAAWKFESAGLDNDHNGTIDVPLTTSILPACVLDNTATFLAGGTGNADEGPTKCTPSAAQTTPFTWSFANNETALNMNGAGLFGLGGQFKVAELSSTKLSLSRDTTIVLISTTLIVNLQH